MECYFHDVNYLERNNTLFRSPNINNKKLEYNLRNDFSVISIHGN